MVDVIDYIAITSAIIAVKFVLPLSVLFIMVSVAHSKWFRSRR